MNFKIRGSLRKATMINREIRCAVLDKEAGEKCDWKTTDSKRTVSTGNMIDHLRKEHSIDSSNKPEAPKRTESNILSFINGKERLTHQQLLEKNILRWIVEKNNRLQPWSRQHSNKSFVIFRELCSLLPPVKLLDNGWPMSSLHN
ncbi:hypothetical protein LIPSTDRAFT_332821 [Lipomyces starkeyi NRRL Y-11557]|uniref:Uncharacterized protein n=1 Tax=Lipomyces starkeyi NRRL Y-11557 TaxID=675824 RepID=A0A1E3Q0G3_LIPST|nr:hypothetical protein LIPSTDRAFT_332821 [Lipomyces starkeyi NRRL Y-11557]